MRKLVLLAVAALIVGVAATAGASGSSLHDKAEGEGIVTTGKGNNILFQFDAMEAREMLTPSGKLQSKPDSGWVYYNRDEAGTDPPLEYSGEVTCYVRDGNAAYFAGTAMITYGQAFNTAGSPKAGDEMPFRWRVTDVAGGPDLFGVANDSGTCGVTPNPTWVNVTLGDIVVHDGDSNPAHEDEHPVQDG